MSSSIPVITDTNTVRLILKSMSAQLGALAEQPIKDFKPTRTIVRGAGGKADDKPLWFGVLCVVTTDEELAKRFSEESAMWIQRATGEHVKLEPSDKKITVE